MNSEVKVVVLAAVVVIIILIIGFIVAYSPPGSLQTTSSTTSENVQQNFAQETNWTMVNYDNSMSRHSPQMQIGKDNVNQLQVKWILNTGSPIENPPLIVGKTGYTQNNNYQVIALIWTLGRIRGSTTLKQNFPRHPTV